MTPNEWAALIVAGIAIVTGFAGGIKWLVKHYLSELKNNGGGSIKDQVERLENRVDQIYLILCERESK